MYKLIIVDDEKDIQESLSQFNWSDLGIELIAICENGLIAYKTVLETDVDIILTDIRMPIMDGMKLIEFVRAERSYIKVVILSAYSDYNYMRTSLNAGVYDYILKPIDPDELKRVFQMVVSDLDLYKQQQSKKNFLESQLRFATKALRNDFLMRLFTTELSEEEIIEKSTYSEIPMDGGCFTFLVFHFDDIASIQSRKSPADWDLIVFGLEKMIDDFLRSNDAGYGWVNRNNGDCHILIVDHEKQKDKDAVVSIARSLKDVIYSVVGLFRSTMSCAICYRLTDYRTINKNNAKARDLLNYNKVQDTMLFVSNVDGYSNILHDSAIAQENEVIDNANSQRYIIKQAIHFINENYMRTITLSDVASAVFLNPVYLSNIFKKYTKINFIEYLTNYRIEKAKLLLENPKYKISDVGENVGYENARYFTQVFKKTTDYTPNEFRNIVLKITENKQEQ